MVQIHKTISDIAMHMISHKLTFDTLRHHINYIIALTVLQVGTAEMSPNRCYNHGYHRSNCSGIFWYP